MNGMARAGMFHRLAGLAGPGRLQLLNKVLRKRSVSAAFGTGGIPEGNPLRVSIPAPPRAELLFYQITGLAVNPAAMCPVRLAADGYASVSRAPVARPITAVDRNQVRFPTRVKTTTYGKEAFERVWQEAGPGSVRRKHASASVVSTGQASRWRPRNFLHSEEAHEPRTL